MNKTTIIIPIHKLVESDMVFFNKTVKSIDSQKDKNFDLMIVLSKQIEEEQKDEIVSLFEVAFPTILWNTTEKTDYASQMNFAVEQVKTKYFTILQFDDEMCNNYIMNVNAHKDVDLYTSLISELDGEGKFLGFSNESTWAVNHMDVFGTFDLANAKKHNFFNYNLCGATINCATFKELGGFKSSMVKYHDYEFLLRLLFKGKVAYVIPKLMYRHVNGRIGSLHDKQKDMLENEKKFWYNLAKKEYHFDWDREIEYVEQSA